MEMSKHYDLIQLRLETEHNFIRLLLLLRLLLPKIFKMFSELYCSDETFSKERYLDIPATSARNGLCNVIVRPHFSPFLAINCQLKAGQAEAVF